MPSPQTVPCHRVTAPTRRRVVSGCRLGGERAAASPVAARPAPARFRPAGMRACPTPGWGAVSTHVDAYRDPNRPRDRTQDLRHPGRQGQPTRSSGKGYSVVDGRGAQDAADRSRRAPCSTPRSRPSTASSRRPAAAPPTTWRWRASSASTSRTCTPRRRSPREALTDECEILVVGAGFAGLLLWYKLQPGRVRRRPLLREGRRRRRHLVLEPLPGHRLRRRVLQLLPAARGDGLLPDDEVRVGLRDLRVLPEDGGEVRLLRPLPVPHDGRARPSGTRTPAAGPSTPTAATPCGPAS